MWKNFPENYLSYIINPPANTPRLRIDIKRVNFLHHVVIFVQKQT